MKLSTKNITINNPPKSFKTKSESKNAFGKVLLNTKDRVINDSLSKDCNVKAYINSLNVSAESKLLSVNTYSFTPTSRAIQDMSTIELSIHSSPLGLASPTIINSVSVIEMVPYEFNSSVSKVYLWSVPLNLKKIIVSNDQSEGYEKGSIRDYTEYGIDIFLKDHIYEFEGDELPLFYKNSGDFASAIKIVKNRVGYAYFPLFGSNNIGNISQEEGYELSIPEGIVYLKVTGEALSPIQTVNDLDIVLVNGWNWMPFPSLTPINAVDFFAPLVAEDKLVIANNPQTSDGMGLQADSYMPSLNFNRLGSLKPGEAYRIKLNL